MYAGNEEVATGGATREASGLTFCKPTDHQQSCKTNETFYESGGPISTHKLLSKRRNGLTDLERSQQVVPVEIIVIEFVPNGLHLGSEETCMVKTRGKQRNSSLLQNEIIRTSSPAMAVLECL